MAEVSNVSGSLTIFRDSFKILSKNGKFTILSLLLPSVLVLLIFFIFQTLINSITKPHHPPSTIAYLSILLLLEIACIIAYAKISHVSGIATILVSATSYTHTQISSQQLYSIVKSTSSQSNVCTSSKSTGTRILTMLVWMLVIFIAILYPNPVTISMAVVVGVPLFIFELHAWVPRVLSHIVAVVEEKFEGSDALEKAEQLLQGGVLRHHGFIINLFVYLPFFIILLLGFLLVLDGRLWSLNITEFECFFIIYLWLVKICINVAYTVLYFQCKKYHGEEEEVGVANFVYSRLPASNLAGDTNIP